MQMSRRGTGPVIRAFDAGHERGHRLRVRTGRQGSRSSLYLVGSLVAASFCMSAAQAVTFGHSRIVSALGQPLHLEIPVTQLTPGEIDSLQAVPAPAKAWREAGMTPPVALDSIRLVLLDGYRADSKVIQLRSDQIFDQPIVDVLLDVRSVSGQQRYQVSLFAYADTHAIQRAGDDSVRHPRPIDGQGAATAPVTHKAVGRRITVRPGDTMFSIARRNAVEGVTIYQMMMALQRTNSQAFVHDNVNLVKAGATLTVPDMDALTALSDREARRLFVQHAQAFARMRQRSGEAEVAALASMVEAARGEVEEEPAPVNVEAVPERSPAKGGDRLRLAGGSVVDGPSGAEVTARSTIPPNSTSNSSGNGIRQGGIAVTGSNGAAGTALGRNGANANGTTQSVLTTPAGSAGAGDSKNAPVSLLAASGAIASDAVADKMPNANARDVGSNVSGPGFGSDADSAGTLVDSGASFAHPDDVAAQKKGLDESNKRILELEDNVRHLNEALQKQGHVAAEAALEGARSVSEVFKEVMNLVDPDAEEAPVPAEGSAREQPQANGGDEQKSAASGAALGAGGATPAASSDSGPAASPAPVAGEKRGASAPAASAGSAQGSRSQTFSGRFTPDEPASSAHSPIKAEKKVSWWQENMLILIGAGLALLVAVVVWLLRRASAAKRGAFESDSPITDSMLQDKLREIDLDLDSPPARGAGSRT